MPLHSQIVGQTIPPIQHDVDARWLMAYAAALGDHNHRYMDTAAQSVIAHPIFPVCVEWPVILQMRAIAGMHHLTAEEAARGVHAAHDLHLLAPITAGDQLTTAAQMTAVEATRSGARYVMRLDTHNQHNTLVAQTWQTGIYRGVDVIGETDSVSEKAPSQPEHQNSHWQHENSIQVAAGLAHTYTECARIWNPIHTDRAVALKAGLPDIILHGTATLALAVSNLVTNVLGGETSRVARVGGRFAAVVLMPSTIQLNYTQVDRCVHFEVLNEAGESAIRNGFLEIH